MSTSYGELAWRERREEATSILTIQGATARDVLRNNELPLRWEGTDAQGETWKVSADYIMSKVTIRAAAKKMGITLESVYNLTGAEAEKLLTYYPRYLYEDSPKKKLFHNFNDQQMVEVQRTTETAIKRQIMFNKWHRELYEKKKAFAGGEKMFVLVTKIRAENALMQASARASNAVIDSRLEPLILLCDCTSEVGKAITDTELRDMMTLKLKELQSELRDELPETFYTELNKWSTTLLKEYMERKQREMGLEEGGEDDD